VSDHEADGVAEAAEADRHKQESDMGLGLSGVFSGMDTDTLITQLMTVNARPMIQYQARKGDWQARDKAVADVQSRLTTLRTLVARMRDSSSLRGVAPFSSDSTILTASVDATAGEGSHTVEIGQLAKADKLVHTAGLAELTSTVGAAESTALNANGVADADATWFTTTANGATYTFDFGTETDIDGVAFAASAGYSMNQVRDLINARSQAVASYDAAAVEYDSQESKYFLRLTADQSATEATLTQTLTAGDAIDEIHDDVDWSKTAAGEGTFQYTYDGTTRTLHISEEATLEDLRGLINNDGANPGVIASILEYNNAYHLVLTGRDTGSDHGITIDNFATTLAGFDAGDFTQTQAAQDAQVRVDNYPSGDWITRSSNTVSDVIPGVTLSLRTANSTANLTLTRNTADLENDLSNFVSIYNGIGEAVDRYTGYDAETSAGGVLQGDSTLNGFLGQIRARLTSSATGFTADQDTYIRPGQIGLKFDRYGELSIVGTSTETETSLSDALSADFLGVLKLIGAKAEGQSDDSYIQFDSAREYTTAGAYDVEVDFAADGSIEVARIKGEGETAWRFLTLSGNTLIGATGNDEEGLMLTAVSDGTPGAHTQTATVRVRQGFAGAIYDYLDGILDATDGAVAGKREHIQDTIDDLDDRIDVQMDRLEDQEERLRAQFARLEGLLASYDRQMVAVQQLSTQVNSFANYLSNK